jgi:hypothetical protein
LHQWRQVTYIFSTHSYHAFFIWYKYCKESQTLCFKTIFFKHIILKRPVKCRYLFHCPFSRKAFDLSKQIHLYVFLIGKESELEPVVVRSNWICQSLNARPNLYITMLFYYHIYEKSIYIFTETICPFVCFLPVFANYHIRVYLSTFQILSISL